MTDNYPDAMKALQKTVEKIAHSPITDDDMKLIEADVVAVTRILFDNELKEIFQSKEDSDREIASMKAKLKTAYASIRKEAKNLQALADQTGKHRELHRHDDDDLKAKHNVDQEVRDSIHDEKLKANYTDAPL